MNKRLLLAFVLLVSINLGSMAQLLPIKNVPSPEIAVWANTGKYRSVYIPVFLTYQYHFMS